jgi:hypothetical protein
VRRGPRRCILLIVDWFYTRPVSNSLLSDVSELPLPHFAGDDMCSSKISWTSAGNAIEITGVEQNHRGVPRQRYEWHRGMVLDCCLIGRAGR